MMNSNHEDIDLPSINELEYDVIFHLFGEERLSIFFVMKQFKAKTHIFIVPQRLKTVVKEFIASLQGVEGAYKFVYVTSSIVPQYTTSVLMKAIRDVPLGLKMALNLTGGTTSMLAGAFSACILSNLETFYFDPLLHQFVFLRRGEGIPFTGQLLSVKEIFNANGYYVRTDGFWESKPWRAERVKLTYKILQSRKSKKLEGLLSSSTEHRFPFEKVFGEKMPISWGGKNGKAFLNKEEMAEVQFGEHDRKLADCPDFSMYVNGVWLEEAVYYYLKSFEKDGRIFDLRIGMEISTMENEQFILAEFDCIFTDASALWIVECKTGVVKYDDIQKLENKLKTYGGASAKGLFVSAFPISPELEKRVTANTSITCMSLQSLSKAAFSRLFVAEGSVDKFFLDCGFKAVAQVDWRATPLRKARIKLANELLQSPEMIRQMRASEQYKTYQLATDRAQNPPFNWCCGGGVISLSEDGVACIQFSNVNLRVPKWDDFGEFLRGKWLREYVFKLLVELEKLDLIYDVRMGIHLEQIDCLAERQTALPVLDCVFTDGKRLWIIQCHAEPLNKKMLTKLNDELQMYGGDSAQGLIITSYNIAPSIREIIESSQRITSVERLELSLEILAEILTGNVLSNMEDHE